MKKIIVFIVFAIGIAIIPQDLHARGSLAQARRERKNQIATYDWWPRCEYAAAKNGVSLSMKALSEEETARLFLDAGSRLVNNKSMGGWSKEPIVPLCITIKNDLAIPVMLCEKNISLGKKWHGTRCKPINIANVVEQLEHRSWSQEVYTSYTPIYNSSFSLSNVIETHKVNSDPLFYCNFFVLDSFPLEHLSHMETAVMDIKNGARDSVTVHPDKSTTLLMFVWGTEISKDFQITIGRDIFLVDMGLKK